MIYAVVLAGGSGKRMNSDVKKQYINLCGKPVLYYALAAFERSNVDGIVVVAGKDDINFVRSDIIKKYNLSKITAVVEGGKERYNSVYNGLCAIDDTRIVLVHDGARPFVSTRLINEMIEVTKKCGASIAAVRVKDTIKSSDENNCVAHTLPRENLWQVQTPQAFDYKKLKKAYELMFDMNLTEDITDDAMVWERFAGAAAVRIVEGSYSNIKITTPDDLVFGRAIITERESYRDS